MGDAAEVARNLARPGLEDRVAALEALLAHPPMAIKAPEREFTEEQAAAFREEFGKLAGQPDVHWLSSTLTPDVIRDLIRECVTVVKPGEVLAVRLPLDMRHDELARAREYALEVEEQTGIKVAFLPGEEFAAIAQGDAE